MDNYNSTTSTDTTAYSSASSRTVTAFFEDRSDAESAAESIISSGISRDNVTMVAGKEPGTADGVPAVETKGFWDSLSDFFFPDDDRRVYAEGLRRGGYLVTVSNLTDSQYDTAVDILDDEGSIDLDERADTWRADGWMPTNPGFDSATATQADTRPGQDAYSIASDRRDDGDVIPVVQEDLKVGKRDVNNGRVRVRSYVVETPVSETVALRDDAVSIERRAVDRPVSDADRAFQDRTIEAEEHREEAVVSKDARVTEEVVLRKTEGQRTETIDDTVRHTKVEVEDQRAGQTQSLQGQRQNGESQTFNK